MDLEPVSQDLMTEATDPVIHVLIVDDNQTMANALATYMNKLNFNAQAVSSAEKALELLKAESFDVVITDIMMPEIDGLELTERIKQNYEIDVIVMTGYGADYSYEEAVNKGASDFIFKPVRFEELILRLKRVLRERRLSKERNLMLSELERLAITDGLTKLYNSRHFYNQLEVEVTRSRRYQNPLSLLLIDIDFFKQFNDRYGHLEGDKVLMRLGQIIKEMLRKMDSAYRYGGEEFTVILPETSGNEAKIVAQRIRTAIMKEKFSPNNGQDVTITISIGVTQYHPNEEVKDFVNRSDRAMYTSKAAGRNRVSFLPAQEETES